MNLAHNMLCSSGWWSRRVKTKLVPWGVAGVDLHGDVLEIGPGFGATTRELAPHAGSLTVVEQNEGYCQKLRSAFDGQVTVVHGDATAMPFEDGRFSTVLCFTMLHHVPERGLQDRVLAEVARVLAPGGWFAGTDSVGTGALFKLIHVGDTLVPIDPDELPSRLVAAGFEQPAVDRVERSFRFRARTPA
jgi:ubiquinone/menaquinone biosynthesis C-methylase UbiE